MAGDPTQHQQFATRQEFQRDEHNSTVVLALNNNTKPGSGSGAGR